jgi:predicted transcriptional regulator
MTIPEMLKALCDAGLSQHQIGELTGVSQPTICRAMGGADLKYEIGKRIEQLYLERVAQKDAPK